MFSTMTLGDGRILEYAERGDPAGVPVLFLHGTPASASQADVVADAATTHGIRLVAPSRPGYGASTTTAPSLATTADDALALADHLGLERFAVLGVSGGGPFALAVAIAAPDRVTAVFVHAGPGEYGVVKPEVLEDEDRRALALLAQGDAVEAMRVMTAMADAEVGGLRGLSPTEFSAAMAQNAPRGGGWLDERPVLKQAFQDDFRRAIVTGEGMARDNLAWLGPWDIDLARVSGHVELVYGDDDHMCEIAHAEWLQARLPDSDLHVVPGGHGAVTFGAAADTFATIAAG